MDDPYRPDQSYFGSSVNPNQQQHQPQPQAQHAGSLSPNTPAPDWIWPGPGTANTAPVPGPGGLNPAPINYHFYPPGQYPDLNVSPPLPPPDGPGMPTPKIPIPRATAAKAAAQRRRSARACEPCRSRKVKCDAERPACRKCREHGMDCHYVDIKRIRDQKQLRVLGEKVERYEKFLRQLESESDPATTRKIKRALAVCFSFMTWTGLKTS